MKLFSGTSNKELAANVARSVNQPLGAVEITRFADNECRVFVREAVAGEPVFVLQSLSDEPDQYLVELCLLGQAVKSLGAASVTALVPWLGYSKQDKAFRKGEAVSAQLVAKFIESAGFDAVMTLELHSQYVLQYFRIPVSDVSTHHMLFAALGKMAGDHADTVVVSPDKGGKSRSERFAKEAGLPVVYLEKSRDVSTGSVTMTGISGSVRGKTVIVFDDIINTGETAVKTAEYVKKNGAESVYFLATHAVLAGDASEALEKSPISRIIVTDTIAIPERKRTPKLSVVSVSRLIADAITG